MDKDRIAGTAKQAKGTLEVAAGKVLGDASSLRMARTTKPRARSRTPSAA